MIHAPLILHVEDDNATAYLLQTAFRQAGQAVEVMRLCDGEEACNFLERAGPYAGATRPDLVLLDLHLPKMSGHEVLAQIRKKEDLRTMPVIVLTSSVDDKDRREALSGGANEYMIKPSGHDGYSSVIGTVMEYVTRSLSHGR